MLRVLLFAAIAAYIAPLLVPIDKDIWHNSVLLSSYLKQIQLHGRLLRFSTMTIILTTLIAKIPPRESVNFHFSVNVRHHAKDVKIKDFL